MKYFYLIWRGLWRKPARTALTAVSLMTGFLLFGIAQGIDSAFNAAVARQRVDRLLTDSRFGQAPLPLSYHTQIEKVPGVTTVGWTAFLPGTYQDRTKNVLVIATAPERFFAVRNEFETEPAQLAALLAKRTGLLALESVASTHGWKIGDQVTLQSPIPKRNGSHDWEFEIVGFMRNPANPGQVGFGLANYDYFNENRIAGQGTVGRFITRIEDPSRSAEVGAAIDKLFENSPAPTRTANENEVAQADLASVGDVSLLARGIITAVFFSLLHLTAHTVLQSVRERSKELAVLKTLGFSDRRTWMLIVCETLLLCVGASVVGLALAALVFPAASAHLPSLSGYVGNADFSSAVVLHGLAFAVALALVSSTIPAWRTARMTIAEALAR